MKTIILYLCIAFGFIIYANLYTQEFSPPGHSEFYVFVENMPNLYQYDNPIIVMEKVSTIWGNKDYKDRKDMYTLPLPDDDSACYDYAKGKLFIYGSDSVLLFEGCFGGTEPGDMYFSWGKYKVTIGYGAADKDESDKWLFFHHDSMYIDFTDSNYAHYTAAGIGIPVDLF